MPLHFKGLTELYRTRWVAIDTCASAFVNHIWSGRDRYLWALTSFCPKLQNHLFHIQSNSNYHHLMFYSDKMVQKVDSWPHLVSSWPWPLTFWPQNVISSSSSSLKRPIMYGVGWNPTIAMQLSKCIDTVDLAEFTQVLRKLMFANFQDTYAWKTWKHDASSSIPLCNQPMASNN